MKRIKKYKLRSNKTKQDSPIIFAVLNVRHLINIIIKPASVLSQDPKGELSYPHKVVEFVVAKVVLRKIESILIRIKIIKKLDTIEKDL